MNTLMKWSALMMVLALTTQCESPTDSDAARQAGAGGEWLIPENEIYDGGPGKDGIPALTNPQMAPIENINYLSNLDLVVGFFANGETRAYPHDILDWHEIVNDEVGGRAVAITYCPLTGSGMAWNRTLDGQKTTFGVSGLLYNSNLIPYDRATDSNWSQMKLMAVNGKHSGTEAQNWPVLETTWDTWKQIAPESRVVTTSTGYNRDYGRYPYGGYKTNHASILFPVSNRDGRLPNKTRVLGLLTNGEAKAYAIKDFGSGINVVHDTLGGEPIVVVGSSEYNFAIAFKNPQNFEFDPVQNQLPRVMKNKAGNLYSIWGEQLEPESNSRLQAVNGYVAYWFAWAAFWPDTKLN